MQSIDRRSYRFLWFSTISGQRSSGNAYVSGAVGLRFKSRGSQIEHSVAKGSLPLRHCERSWVPGRNDAEKVAITANSLRALTLNREYNERFIQNINVI